MLYDLTRRGRRSVPLSRLGDINEEEVEREIERETSNSPLLRINQNGKLLSAESGVNLDETQDSLLTHNKIFEAKMSMSIMDNPGKIGSYLDQYAGKLARVFAALKNEASVRAMPVTFGGKAMTLGEVFERTTFTPLRSTSDQIGRMSGAETSDVESWILASLNKPISAREFKEFLTRIKLFSSFGTTVWQLLTSSSGAVANKDAVNALLASAGLSESNHDLLTPRFAEFKRKTRSLIFDDMITRARSERMPLVQGMPVSGIYENAGDYGLGFGQVVQKSRIEAETRQLRELLDVGGKNAQINAIPRQNAPIGDLNRPFMLSDKEFSNLPDEYKHVGLAEDIQNHIFNHGVGINRWQPYGIYGTDANRSGYPSAGAQSGGTTDVMLALTMLELKNHSIYSHESKDAILAMTLAVSAFMNFGGYHTFSEVFPIGQAIVENIRFIPAEVARKFRTSRLYEEMMRVYMSYLDDEESVRALNKFEATHRKLTLPLRHKNVNKVAPDEYQGEYSTVLAATRSDR
ncbi:MULTISPECIES: hypothetical protein [unclassified Burkholderia]|uniref:hypothetical protein n=1 Tax=unclassified Burkholderia TaxID=2613784 RepID=UPI00075B3E7B|nr:MULTISPECIES: hypothetical protein [unclassified Burkholderia]KVN20671.1 hypothetical protein WT08_28195 [Burkholderia sp. MSMB1552]KWZ46954.1 hypothetical protein WS92_29895 [Burkholderia sp. MSMB1588]